MSPAHQDTDPYQFCAQSVYEIDPDRFADIMTLALPQRKIMFAGFALFYEIAKAAVVSQEPHLCAMRLEWWRQEMERLTVEVKADHEISAAIQPFLNDAARQSLIVAIEARDWDVYEQGFNSAAALEAYWRQSMGKFYRALALMLERDADAAEDYGTIVGLHRWLYAAHYWHAKGRQVWPIADQHFSLEICRKYLEKLDNINKKTLGRGLVMDWHRLRYDLRRVAQNGLPDSETLSSPNAARIAFYRLRASIGL